jgi:hypothetical protein
VASAHPNTRNRLTNSSSEEPAAPKIPNDQLDALVPPIALYSDPLLSQEQRHRVPCPLRAGRIEIRAVWRQLELAGAYLVSGEHAAAPRLAAVVYLLRRQL